MEQWKLLAIKRIDKTIEGFKEYPFYKRNYVNLVERCPVCKYMLKSYGIIMNPMVSCVNKQTKMECPVKDSCARYLKIRRTVNMAFISILKLRLLKLRLKIDYSKSRFGHSKHLCRTCYNNRSKYCYLGKRITFFIACKLYWRMCIRGDKK